MAEHEGGIVERFFECLTARDWEELGAVLAPDVERVGPFGDRVVGRRRYLDLLSGVVTPRYRNDVHRVTYASDGRSAFARVTEHLTYPEQELHLEEAYSFHLDESGVISRVEVFWQTPSSGPGRFASAASEDRSGH
jgi:ketosteroid isomerase-like protein